MSRMSPRLLALALMEIRASAVKLIFDYFSISINHNLMADTKREDREDSVCERAIDA